MNKNVLIEIGIGINKLQLCIGSGTEKIKGGHDQKSMGKNRSKMEYFFSASKNPSKIEYFLLSYRKSEEHKKQFSPRVWETEPRSEKPW